MTEVLDSGVLELLICRLGCLQVAWVRRKGAGRALPRAHLQADLDIATLPGSSPSETMLADAEVIRAVSEVRRTPAHLSAFLITHPPHCLQSTWSAQ